MASILSEVIISLSRKACGAQEVNQSETSKV